jgi:Fur family ferric uptake transcriptional regulator
MAGKGQYKTKQREELLRYLRKNPGAHFTARDLSRHFESQGCPIGTATIYRQLDGMIEEGLVHKYIIDENSSACFAYVDPADHCRKPICYHCKCEKCGRLIHLDCTEIAALQSHLAEHHGFAIDPTRTVFYGVCADCRAAE